MVMKLFPFALNSKKKKKKKMKEEETLNRAKRNDNRI